MNVADFADLARTLGAAARGAGLHTPGFRGSHNPQRHRVLRGANTSSPTVCIDLGRSDKDVVEAMIDGVLAANRLPLDDPIRIKLKETQWASSGSANAERVEGGQPSSVSTSPTGT